MQKENVKILIEKAFELSETISEFKKFVLDIVDSWADPIVNIHIDTLQKNYGVKESKAQAEETVRKLSEMINGFSDDQNSKDKEQK